MPCNARTWSRLNLLGRRKSNGIATPLPTLALLGTVSDRPARAPVEARSGPSGPWRGPSAARLHDELGEVHREHLAVVGLAHVEAQLLLHAVARGGWREAAHPVAGELLERDVGGLVAEAVVLGHL